MQNLGTSRSRNIVVTTAYFSRWHIFFAEECEYASKNTIADDKDLNVETLLVSLTGLSLHGGRRTGTSI